MDAAQKAFWEAVGADGPVPAKDLLGRIDDVLTEHPEFIRLEGVNNYALYSGGIMHGGATQAAVDLAGRTDGAIGIINNTPTGQALEPFARLAGNAGSGNNLELLREQYGQYIDIPEVVNEDWIVTLEEASWNTFKPASSHFAHHATGNVITITPDATADRVYAHSEVPLIADGMRPDPESGIRRITHVNGVPAETFDVTLEKLPPLEGSPYRASEALLERQPDGNQISLYEPLRVQFDESFKENFRDAKGRVGAAFDETKGPYSTRTTMEVDDWDKVLPEMEGRIAPASFEGLIEQHAANKYQAASLAKLQEADAAGRLRTFTDDAGKTHAVDLQGHATYTLEFDPDTGIPKVSDAVQYPDAETAGRAFGQSLSGHGDMSSIQRSLSGAAEHVSDLGRSQLANNIDEIASEGGKFLGRASKVLGPLGVAAAGAEAASLEMKLQDFEDFGLVDPEAMLAYRAILVTHTAQATVDPTLVGGEAVTQGAYHQWKEHYGIDDKVGKELQPGSLVKDVYTAKQWLDAQADAAGEATIDYAKSVIENPSRLITDVENIREATATAVEAAYEAGSEQLEKASEVLERYGSSRIENPSLILDDLATVGRTSADIGASALKTINPALRPAMNIGRAAIERLRGDEAPEVELDPAAPISGDLNAEGSRVIDMREALQDLHDTQTGLQITDPQGNSTLSQVLNHTEGQALFKTLVDARVDGLRVNYGPDAPADTRISGLFESAQAEIQARGLEPELQAQREALDTSQIAPQIQTPTPNNQEEYYEYDSTL